MARVMRTVHMMHIMYGTYDAYGMHIMYGTYDAYGMHIMYGTYDAYGLHTMYSVHSMTQWTTTCDHRLLSPGVVGLLFDYRYVLTLSNNKCVD